MIIIYNLAGLIVGAAGVLLGGMITAATGMLGAGVLTIALVWLVLGFLWRGWKMPPGQRRPYPSVFFIPLPFLAIPVLPLAVLILVGEVTGGGHTQAPGGAVAATDPRVASFQDDERTLSQSAVGGDAELSQYLASALAAELTEKAKADKYHVFTRVNPESVLVLVKAPNLRAYKEKARVQLLQAITELLARRDDLKEKKAYIGIKGNLTFGAIQVPPNRVETGSVVLEQPLYDFYGPAPGTPADTQPASISNTTPPTPPPGDATVPTPEPVDEPAND